ncbi:hypothetical protein V6N13_009154 [Hibiscus sabdariffa]
MNGVNEARGENEIVVEDDHSDSDFHDSEYEIDEGDDAIVMDRTLGVITNAPMGAIHSHQQAQHPARTQEVAREAICSVLGLHHVIQPGPSLGLQETSTTDMARE